MLKTHKPDSLVNSGSELELIQSDRHHLFLCELSLKNMAPHKHIHSYTKVAIQINSLSHPATFVSKNDVTETFLNLFKMQHFVSPNCEVPALLLPHVQPFKSPHHFASILFAFFIFSCISSGLISSVRILNSL